MEKWYKKVNMDAKAAYYLVLSEKVLDKLAGYDWFSTVRKSMDMCWEWTENKKGDSYLMYLELADEDKGFYIIGLEYDDFEEGSQEEFIYWCLFLAVSYTVKQALLFEKREHEAPQEIQPIDDEYMEKAFMQNIRKVNGCQEEWFKRLKEYLLKNHPAGSDKENQREELLRLIV
ncbi:Imm6 family immunity protein [Thermoactinomyces sp. CICC 23799]|jgi:hypothetical protein|uniref:Imm6 family immunity protein n=1 Tax=Thermoactinomyces sp. CICC 23799 TaxID=2767429 RepID=UPI0018DE8A1C|nr:Imm6 family immunity protein [Thermoactinomyces sp. CICC 23799]MBH8602066.1 hypothetical protein [Thermoactinomyces sp. CICC 23799]